MSLGTVSSRLESHGIQGKAKEHRCGLTARCLKVEIWRVQSGYPSDAEISPEFNMGQERGSLGRAGRLQQYTLLCLQYNISSILHRRNPDEESHPHKSDHHPLPPTPRLS